MWILVQPTTPILHLKKNITNMKNQKNIFPDKTISKNIIQPSPNNPHIFLSTHPLDFGQTPRANWSQRAACDLNKLSRETSRWSLKGFRLLSRDRDPIPMEVSILQLCSYIYNYKYIYIYIATPPKKNEEGEFWYVGFLLETPPTLKKLLMYDTHVMPSFADSLPAFCLR